MNLSKRTHFERHNCPTQQAVMLIGDKWTLFILREFIFGEQKQGFNKLIRALKPISSRTLALKLRKLLDSKLIVKRTISKNPPRGEYSITSKGLALRRSFSELAQWYNENP